MPEHRPIWVARRFVKTWRTLTQPQKDKITELLVVLPDLLGNPHLHSGFGFRRLIGTAFHEARLDLRWRLILRISPDEIVLFDVMNHDQVQRL